MVERAATIEADKRPDTRTLQKKFEETYNLDPHTCELSGDTLAVQIMHLVPPELGSGVFYELLHAVQTRATSHWTIMGDILRKFPPNEAAPIIGNIALLPKNVNLVDEKAKGSINSAKNLGPGAASLHWVGDKHNGFSLSTTPPIWLDRADTCHSVTAFLKEVKHERLPKVKPMRISSVADRCRFIVRSLSDAAKLYLRFASPSLRSRINEITEKLKVELEAIKKKRKNTEELEGERAKKKKKTAGTKNTQPYDRDGDNDREDRGGRDNADKPKDLSDKSENAPDGNANNGGEGSSGGGFPSMWFSECNWLCSV
ncbi:hypothetical protein B0H19DRAFT_649761 [Mycena capillaripes]|nr:hypothetical protein B0H19DRAFT_649761 [Mycena capillaripes]